MSDEDRRVDREGIHIDREVAESVSIDSELDSNVAGPFRFPEPARRRVSAWVLVGFAVVALLTIEGGWPVAVVFAGLAVWMFASAWPLRVDEHEALRTAGTAVDFPVGHASATLRFKGWRSRPRWSVVLYSAAEPPDQRALVVVD
ncbi:MAG: putative manganese transporter, partial [Actinobacteria bacterium]|nr:putative manganese transporter [Actinomycetota bacterium]